MKNIFKLTLGFIACVTMFTACNDEEGPVQFQVDKEKITVNAEGATEVISVTSGEEWMAIASEPWISLSPANGVGSALCNVAIDSTLIETVRSAVITFSSRTQQPKTVEIKQMGFGNIVSVDESEVEIEANQKLEKRFFDVEVVSNVKFKVKCTAEDGETAVDWVTFKQPDLNLDYGKRPRTLKVRFNWMLNSDPEERKAKIQFLPVDESVKLNQEAVVSLTQKAAPLIEDNRSGDSLALMIIQDKMNSMVNAWDPSENMRNWENVTLWEDGDKDMPEGAEGRVRSASFMLLDTKEGIPQEVKHLKYIESLAIQSNTNTMLKSIDLGSDICELEHLKKLTIFAYGLTSLPADFHRLKSLEYLDLSANNFETVPEVLTPENFPNMKGLRMVANRRWTCNDLTKKSEYASKDGIGMNFVSTKKDNNNVLRRLLRWDSLEYIGLSNNYIEGELPDFEVGVDGVRAYTEEDIAARGDTLSYLVNTPEGQKIPRIMPNLKFFAINLNFFTGKIPDWMLYHPYLMEWMPTALVFSQQEKGVNSAGKVVNFENVPSTFDYYYEAYPRYKDKYEMKEEFEEE